MDKKIKGKRGSEYPLKLRGFALLLSLMILCSYFPVYAIDEYKETSEYYTAMAQSDDSLISSMHYETMSYLYSINDAIKESRQKMNDNFANIYRNADGEHPANLIAIYERVGSVYTTVNSQGDRITSNLTSLKIQLQSYMDSSFSAFYSSLMPIFTSLKTQVNAHVDEVFGTLENTFQQGSTDIQNNADKNSQNQIDNANKNAEEQKQNDNENTSKIGGFFDKFFENISNFLKSLFMPSDDYFDILRADLDTYLTEHLGVVYELPVTLLEETKTMYSGIRNQNINTVSLYIRVPEISFTLNGVKHTLLRSQSYDLFAFFSQMPSQFQSAYNNAIKIMRAFIDISLAVACFRMIYKQIINKVGIEGGSDL